jgi:hypothetical protein
VVLQFIRVLDTYEFSAEPEEEPAELVDRAYWEKKSNPESLALIEQIKALAPTSRGEPKLTYNRHHIALGTGGYNFCWFHPRRVASHCHMHIKLGAEKRQQFIDRLEQMGIEAGTHGPHSIRLALNRTDIDENRDTVSDLIAAADEWSHR